MSADMTSVLQEIARLQTLQQTEQDRCPHREAIARASNNARRLESVEGKQEELEERVTGMRIELAKMAAIAGLSGGGGATVIGAIAYAVAKAAGLL